MRSDQVADTQRAQSVDRWPVTVACLLLAAAPLAAQQHQHPQQPQQPQQHQEHRDPAQERMQHNRHLLVNVEQLAARLDSGTVVVLHVGRSDSAYVAGRVPGARFLPLSAVATTVNGQANEFPPLEQMAATFRDLGVGDETPIVLYGDDAGLLAARAWVALDLMGHGDRAALLDGGLVRWRAAARPIQAGPAARPAAAGSLTPRWQPRKLASAEWVRAHVGDSTVLFVDARPADQFGGEEPPCAPGQTPCVQLPPERRGHLPGAVNLFWMDGLVSRQDPALKPMHELHHTLWEPAGADLPRVRTIVTYCRTGVQASHSYFVARYIGYQDVRIYDGSMSEWAALPPAQYPVERAANR